MNTATQIELLRPHRHAGRDYPTGALLSMAPHKAAWLIGVGVARDVSPTAAGSAQTASTFKKTKE